MIKILVLVAVSKPTVLAHAHHITDLSERFQVDVESEFSFEFVRK